MFLFTEPQDYSNVPCARRAQPNGHIQMDAKQINSTRQNAIVPLFRDSNMWTLFTFKRWSVRVRKACINFRKKTSSTTEHLHKAYILKFRMTMPGQAEIPTNKNWIIVGREKDGYRIAWSGRQRVIHYWTFNKTN